MSNPESAVLWHFRTVRWVRLSTPCKRDRYVTRRNFVPDMQRSPAPRTDQQQPAVKHGLSRRGGSEKGWQRE
eukprot:scaffold702_cov350-Pinguiococcus_pyrenoidosus.AAC.1